MLPKSNLFRAFCVFCFCLSLSVFALADTIRLKDGSIIKGKIVSFGGGKFVVMIGDGSRSRQMSFNADEIEKITFDNQTIPTTVAKSTNDASYQKTPPTITKSGDNTVITVGNKNSTPPPVTTSQTAQTDDEEIIDDVPETNTTSTKNANVKPIEIGVKVLADNTSNGWSNSGWVVKKGQKIKITANGRVSLGNGRYTSPTGISSLPDTEKLMKSQPTGSLIAVIGDDNDDFILIGPRREFVAQRDGVLFLGVNEGDLADNTGSYDIVIEAEAVGR